MISDLLDHIPRERQVTIGEAVEEVANLLNPGNEAFQKLLSGCRCNIPAGGDNPLTSIQEK